MWQPAAGSRVTGPDREPLAIAALRGAFAEDPVIDWLFSGEADGAAVLRVLGFYVRISAAAGELVVTADGAAAAVWVPPIPDGGSAFEGVDDDLPPELAAHVERIASFEELVGSRRPNLPHLYLAFIGVVPTYRGRGLGGALMRDRLSRADEQRLPAYLEASTSRGRTLYERLGFSDLGAPVELPDGPTVWPMWRPARPVAR